MIPRTKPYRRIMVPSASSCLEFGLFRLDSAERLLLRGGQPVSLTPKAFDLLVYLVERPGRLVTKQELMTALWPDTFVEEANLTYTVSALRKALGDGLDGEHYIQTVPTRGYRFVAAVTGSPTPTPAEPPPERTSRASRLYWVATIALAAGLVLTLPVVVRHLREPGELARVSRFTIPVPDAAVGTTSAVVAKISPDGRRVAFAVRSQGTTGAGQLWLQSLDEPKAVLVAGTDDARSLFWSPDSTQLAFTTATGVKRLIIASRTVESVCQPCSLGYGGTWSRSGMLILPSLDGRLLGVPASGGTPRAVSSPDRSKGEVAHIAPSFLPDGERYLYVVRNADASRSGLYVSGGTIDGAKLLLQGDHPAIYAPPGYVLFIRDGAVLAQPFDLERLELTGTASPLITRSDYWPTPVQAGDVILLTSFGVWPIVSVSDSGVLAYSVADHPKSQFLWVRRTGQMLQAVGEPGAYATFSLSRDDARFAYSQSSGEGVDVWIRDLSRGISSQLTAGAGSSYNDPRFGPGNRWLAANRPTPPPVAIVKITPDGRDSVVLATENCILDDVSPDGQYLLCRRRLGNDLVAVRLDGSGKPIPVQKPRRTVIDQSSFSPDGKWIAYNADDSGTYEVYVTKFPSTGEHWQVSRGGGVQPTWGQDGREIYYLGNDGVLSVVEMRAVTTPQFSIPQRLFDTGLRAPSPWVEQYAVSSDRQRVLVLKPVSDTVRNSIGVILNWPAALNH